MEFFTALSKIDNTDSALSFLESLTTSKPKIAKAIEDSKRFHIGQLRKSGIPYVVHPICVACIVANYGGDESMVCAALLHDVVEDTLCEIEYIYENYGDEVGKLVNALTKIVEIRNEELPSATSNEKLATQALSFKKILLASVEDTRALVIKISDRMHNMLTLDALSTKKQMRIAEETLLVYAPIAHRLGISSLKNELEDKAFYYLYSDEYNKIQGYMDNEMQNLSLKLNEFKDKISALLLNNGFLKDNFEIQGRVKRPYSIHLKMQNKGMSIDEMLDLLAIRILVNTPLDCYQTLGIVHLHFKPIPSRLKDYVALPKENGYQTIHTTVFDGGAVFEVQIRTNDMHKSAEFGVAAHWKYKSGGITPDTEWVKNIQYSGDSIEEFYDLAKNDLYREDVVVFSPKGKTFTLPAGSVALDYAYAVHSELGDTAKVAYINHQKASLLKTLKNGDIVRIVSDPSVEPRFAWLDSVKTSKAKIHIKTAQNNKMREINRKVACNILATIFEKKSSEILESVKKHNLTDRLDRAANEHEILDEIKNQIKKDFISDNSFFSMLRFKSVSLKVLQFDNLLLYTNRNVKDVSFDFCCHPKFGDSIVAIKSGNSAIVHHKLCKDVNKAINSNNHQIFVKWNKNAKTRFRVVANLGDKIGSMASMLKLLADHNYSVVGVSYSSYKNTFSPLCELIVESENDNINALKELAKKEKAKEFKFEINSISHLKDAYKNS